MRLSPDEIEYYADLLATSFLDDPNILFGFDGIDRPRHLLTEMHKAQLKELQQEDMIYPLEQKGILIGYRSTEKSRLLLFWHMYRISKAFTAEMTQDEKKKYKQNAHKARKVDRVNWYRKYLKTKDYFHIVYIAIDPDARGKGTFRELITPILDKYEKEGIPVVLETHNPNNVPIYEHFGFEVIHIFEEKNVPYKQYCMVKRAPN